MTFYNPTLSKENLIERLVNLDKELYMYALRNKVKTSKIDMLIAGSSALILNGITISKTADIDVLKLSHYIEEELLERYDMNSRVMGVESSIPYNYEDRIVKLDLETKIIQYYLLSIEDAVCSKIQANRGKDWEQINNSNILEQIDWNKLKICAEEMHDSLITDEQFRWFLARYNDFVEVNGHEDCIISDLQLV